MRDLDQHAATVARLGIGADRAAVLEVVQDLQAVGDDAMAFRVGDIGDEADAARIVLEARVLEARCRGHALRQ
jgi:hypothetical protein